MYRHIKSANQLHYDHQPGKDFCGRYAMKWDTSFAERMDKIAHKQGLTQEQWDVMVREHAWRLKTLFNPANYTLRERLRMASYFVFSFCAVKDT